MFEQRSVKGALRTYEKEINADVAELRKELEKAIDEVTGEGVDEKQKQSVEKS